jgi:hypothetical protein
MPRLDFQGAIFRERALAATPDTPPVRSPAPSHAVRSALLVGPALMLVGASGMPAVTVHELARRGLFFLGLYTTLRGAGTAMGGQDG